MNNSSLNLKYKHFVEKVINLSTTIPHTNPLATNFKWAYFKKNNFSSVGLETYHSISNFTTLLSGLRQPAILAKRRKIQYFESYIYKHKTKLGISWHF